MSDVNADLVARARAWMAGDPDPETQNELGALIEAGSLAELGERMAGSLEFGTAGLRGVVGAGSARMNRAVVIRTTAGLAAHVLATEPDARNLPVVVGYDGRTTSRAYAEDAVGVLAAAGLPVRFFDEPVPTPLVAFATRELSATAGICITASHNPPEYNGYKVYASNAVQIVPPTDGAIARRIEAAPPANAVRRSEGALGGAGERAERLTEQMTDRYLAAILAERPGGAADRDFDIVYTPLHGVGWKLVEKTLRLAGYSKLHVVPEQAEPDGRFPTVRFPNPEEPGALDRALALAAEKKADLILANDPDADRLAACVALPTGRYLQLTGNQIGLLLADFALEHAPARPQPLVLSSIVSSPMLADLARERGARSEQTLTGFKWIWNAALDLENDGGVRYAFGYEEALGYCVGRSVRDKDGISAALMLADLHAHCRAAKQSLLDRLHGLYRRHGLWVSVQKSVARPGTAGVGEIAAAMQRLAAAPPRSVGGRAVERVVDFQSGAEGRRRWLPATPLIELGLAGGGRVLARPSGTEPKLKIYVDLRAEVAPDALLSSVEEATLAAARAVADEVAVAMGL